MADQFFDSSKRPDLGNNVAELSVGEVAQAIKRTLEGAFDRVGCAGSRSTKLPRVGSSLFYP